MSESLTSNQRSDLDVALWWAARYREDKAADKPLSGYERSSIALAAEIEQLRRALDTALDQARYLLEDQAAKHTEIERLTTILRKAGVTGAPGPTGEWLPDETAAPPNLRALLMMAYDWLGEGAPDELKNGILRAVCPVGTVSQADLDWARSALKATGDESWQE